MAILAQDPGNPSIKIESGADGQMRFYDSVQTLGVTLSELLLGSNPTDPADVPVEMFEKDIGNGSLKTIYVQHDYQNNHGVAPRGIIVQCWSNLTGCTLTEGKSGDNLVKIQNIDGNMIACVFQTAPGANTISVRIAFMNPNGQNQ